MATTTFDRVGFIMAYECGEIQAEGRRKRVNVKSPHRGRNARSFLDVAVKRCSLWPRGRRLHGACYEEDAVIEGFQHLINEGTVWSLQGSYGRMAAALIEAGYCTDPRDAEPVKVRPELIGTFCECGASYDETRGGYRCAFR